MKEQKVFNFFGDVYDFSHAVLQFNGERITMKRLVVDITVNFIKKTNVKVSYQGLPAILHHYRDVSRSSLVRFLLRLVEQYSTGLVTPECFITSTGFSFTASGDRLFKVVVHFEKRNELRLLPMSEIASFVNSYFEPSRLFKPNSIEIS